MDSSINYRRLARALGFLFLGVAIGTKWAYPSLTLIGDVTAHTEGHALRMINVTLSAALLLLSVAVGRDAVFEQPDRD